jgi:hypothetical protein
MKVNTWPERSTAFVVIHGAGAHRPFETLDKFVRGFRTVLPDPDGDLDVSWRHKLQRHGRIYDVQAASETEPLQTALASLGRLFKGSGAKQTPEASSKGGEQWIENYVSVAPEGRSRLDFYEYYWDCYMDHEIDLEDVIRWLRTVSDGAKQFYSDRRDLAQQHEDTASDLFKDGDFRAGGYFRLLGPVGWFLSSLQTLRIARIPILSQIITLLLRRVSRLLVEMMGDVVIYTDADVRSRNYTIRQQLLGGAVEELRLLLERDEYDQIIVVGHSLGSLIAYDALNRIVLEMNAQGGIHPDRAQKLAGLVTFGSPLDKVAFFFREHTRPEEYIRRQVLAHLHSFKSGALPGDQNPVPIANPVELHLDQAQWLNFYHAQDPVSGHLDAYAVDKNILIDQKVRGSAEAHAVYWTSNQMYQEIAAGFFQAAPATGRDYV